MLESSAEVSLAPGALAATLSGEAAGGENDVEQGELARREGVGPEAGPERGDEVEVEVEVEAVAVEVEVDAEAEVVELDPFS